MSESQPNGEEEIIDLKKGLKIILVGKPGSGKTICYKDAPKPHVVQDIDNKIESLNWLFRKRVTRKIKEYSDFDFDDMKYIQYLPACDFSMFDYNTRQILAKPPMREDNTPGTWTMDSLTTIADKTINYAISTRGGDGGRTSGVIPIPELPEWLTESMFLASLFGNAKDLPCNVILCAHMTIVEREQLQAKSKGATNVIKVSKALMTGGTKIGMRIPAYFSEVWNTKVIPSTGGYEAMPDYKVFTRATDEVEFGRTRLWPLPYEIDTTVSIPEQFKELQLEDGPLIHYKSLWDVIEQAKIQIKETMKDEEERV